MIESGKNDDSWQQLLTEIADTWPPSRWRDVGVIVGCSGGADSVGLLTALCLLRQSVVASGQEPPRGFLVAAHVNHGLRGEESDGDEAFVRELASQQGVQFATLRAAGTDRDEASMRSERFQFLHDTANAMGARYLALGHTADDNVETVLHQLMRGTGPAGLAGIGSPRPIGQDLVLVRPLLGVPRRLIRSGLESIGLPWREDSSNADTDYRRNWIRHQLIPLIESEYPSAVDAITRAVEGQRGWRVVIDRLANQWLAMQRRSSDPPTLVREQETDQAIVIAAVQILWAELDWPRREMTREHWLRLATTIQVETEERYTLPGQIDVVAKAETVEICRLK
jgi:tRNA(Ile)-lysidine synthase